MELCDIPEPEITGPECVKIAVRRGGICGTDLHILEGGYGFLPPVTLGHEISGEVVEVGRSVHRASVGDRVTLLPSLHGTCGRCRYCQEGEYYFCRERRSVGSGRDGGFAEYCVVPESLVFPVASHVGFEAAALIEPFACCVKAVVLSTDIRAGDLVLVTGPGPIGLMCAHLALLAGARVVASGTEGDAERLQTAEHLGAERTLTVQEEEPAEVVRDLSEGVGADAVIECSGAPAAVHQCLEAVRPLGSYTQVALIDHPIEVDFGRIVYKQLRVQGSISQNWPGWRKTLDLVNVNKVDLSRFVSHQLPLEDWDKAFEGASSRAGLKYLLVP